MVVTVRSLGLTGIRGYEVTVECFLSGGLPAFDMVGLPDAAVKESRERVRAAVKNCGAKFPVSRITVNLAPARVRKEGTLYDLPILLGILAAAEELEKEGIHARVIDMHTIKPIDREAIRKAAKETGAIVTTEEANVLGGLGAAGAEYLAETYPVPVVRHGVEDEFGRSGKAPLVLEAYGITPEAIAEKAKKAVAMKR